MARKRHIPAYVHHKPSGQARVRINGKDHYLGVYGSSESKLEYDNLIARYLDDDVAAKPTTLTQLLAKWWAECKRRYGRHGKGRFGNAVCWRPVIRLLREQHGKEPAESLGPATLRRTIEEAAKANDWSLRYTRDVLAKVKAIFLWAKNEELIRGNAYDRIKDLRIRTDSGLHASPKIEPVDDAVVDQTVPHLKSVVADMVRFQQWTGCRPGELVRMKPEDIDRSGDVWECRLQEHKTAHRGKNRTIYIGPRAQSVLAPWLLKAGSFVWSWGRDKPYTADSYRRAISRPIDRVNEKRREEDASADLIPNWSPNQVRKAAATRIRATLDVEHAASILGQARRRWDPRRDVMDALLSKCGRIALSTTSERVFVSCFREYRQAEAQNQTDELKGTADKLQVEHVEVMTTETQRAAMLGAIAAEMAKRNALASSNAKPGSNGRAGGAD